MTDKNVSENEDVQDVAPAEEVVDMTNPIESVDAVSESAGYAVEGDYEDTRMGYGCTSCSRFKFDTAGRGGAEELLAGMSCSACGGRVRYMGYSAWKRSRPELFPNA